MVYFMKSNDLWIFLHPPRTGGNTIIETIIKEYPKEEIYLPSVTRYQKNPETFNPNKVRFMLGHATYYGMHKLVPNKNPKYFVVLRDPAERLISHYNAKMQNEQNKIPFDKWYKNQIKNEMVHVLDLKYNGSPSTRINTPNMFMPLIRKLNYKTTYSLQTAYFKIKGLNKKNDVKKLENAKKLLDACWYVAITEKSDKDFPFLLKSMGVKNTKYVNDGESKKILVLDDKLRQKIYQENPLDWELYNYALDLREKKLNQIS